jgi:hypothetical protein
MPLPNGLPRQRLTILGLNNAGHSVRSFSTRSFIIESVPPLILGPYTSISPPPGAVPVPHVVTTLAA